MSDKGIRIAAGIFAAMQEARRELLGGDKQDMKLGQMLEVGKDAMKWKFCDITSEPGS